MEANTFGPVVVAVATFFFGYLLFRGMVLEWHRRDGESRGQS